MKTKRTKKPAPSATPVNGTKVCVKYHAPEAKRVCVAGSFNEWQPEAAPLKAVDDGLWTLELELPPGTYEYRFVLDGCWWCSDPNATNSVLNPFGDYNAMLRVSGPA